MKRPDPSAAFVVRFRAVGQDAADPDGSARLLAMLRSIQRAFPFRVLKIERDPPLPDVPRAGSIPPDED